jgi:Ser/Thr protein kinase RdoA (MazF antagonist)
LHTDISSEWLALWPGTEGGTASFINLSENHTYRIDVLGAPRFILRLHRPGYQSIPAIESELAWIAALARDTTLPVPEPLHGKDGRLVQSLNGRPGVLFTYKPGQEPLPGDDKSRLFNILGRSAATTHRHAAPFQPPSGFTRPSWTAESILDANGQWGDWRQAPHVVGTTRKTLDALDLRLRADLSAYGRSSDRFGLVHADMRLANILINNEEIRIIDFDDCGFGWFMYDFAAAISFFEDAPEIPALRQSWLDGYTAIRPLSDADLQIVDSMVLLRRMALLAWIGSHHETDLARSHAPTFARVTADLAEAYLNGRVQ